MKFTKKLLVSVLSIIALTTFAVGCDNSNDPSNVKGENIAPSGYVSYVSALNGGSVSFNEEIQPANEKAFKGAVLTGNEGAKFDLGDIDITKGKWQGTHNTVTGEFTSFLEFVHQPTIAGAVEIQSVLITLTEVEKPTNSMQIYVRSIPEKSNNTLTGNYTDNFYIVAKAQNQSKFGSYLSGNSIGLVETNISNKMATSVLKSTVYSDAAKKTGLGDGNLKINAKGSAETPIALIYDKQENCLYSPVTYDNTAVTDKTSMHTSYAVRDFDEIYCDTTSRTGDITWGGFTTNLVNVTLTFEQASAQSSIIITKIGGYDLTGNEVFVADDDYLIKPVQPTSGAVVNEAVTLTAPLLHTVVNEKPYLGGIAKITGNGVNDTVTFDVETKQYSFTSKGDYKISFYKQDGTTLIKEYGIKVASHNITTDTLGVKASTGASAEYGTYKQVAGVNYYTGIKLTGGDNATFDLGVIDLNDTFWDKDDAYTSDENDNYGNASFTSSYESFINVVWHPNTDRNVNVSDAGINRRYAEIDSVYITLTSVVNPNEFVTIALNDGRADDTSSTGAISVTAKATSNPYFRAERYYTGTSNVVFETVSKHINNRGNQIDPVELCYDSGAVYTTSTFNAAGLYGTYCIRNFSNDKSVYSEYKYDRANSRFTTTKADYREKHTTWGGFTSNKVRLTVTFGDVRENYAGGNTTSMIITKIGKFDLSDGAVEIGESDFTVEIPQTLTTAVQGSSVNVYAPIKRHAIYSTVITDSYVEVYANNEKVDTITFTNNVYSYTFQNAGEYTLKYFGGGTLLGSRTITVSSP